MPLGPHKQTHTSKTVHELVWFNQSHTQHGHMRATAVHEKDIVDSGMQYIYKRTGEKSPTSLR